MTAAQVLTVAAAEAAAAAEAPVVLVAVIRWVTLCRATICKPKPNRQPLLHLQLLRLLLLRQ